MITGISSLAFVPLLAISMAHFLWAFGSTFPAKSKHELADIVIGRQPMAPRWASFVAAVAIFTAGIWALALSDSSTNPILRGGGGILTLVFLTRGLIGFTPIWRKALNAEPFASMDRKFYSPLCLGLSVCFAYLTVWPFI